MATSSQTVEAAVARFYGKFTRHCYAFAWPGVLPTCTALGLPEPKRPQTVEDWVGVAHLRRNTLLARNG